MARGQAPQIAEGEAKGGARVRFVEVAEAAGVTAANVWGGATRKRFILETKGNGAGFIDYNNDGWMDIYLSNGTHLESLPPGPAPTNHLYRNNRDGTFSEIAQRAGVAFSDDGYEQGGMGVAVGDYDGDGRLDIFKTNFADDVPNIYRNNADGTFTDCVLAAGLGSLIHLVSWGAGFEDVDND